MVVTSRADCEALDARDPVRHLRDDFHRPPGVVYLDDEDEFAEHRVSLGYPPEVVADDVLDGIRTDRFYVFPAQPFILDQVHDRMNAVIEGRNPTPR